MRVAYRIPRRKIIIKSYFFRRTLMTVKIPLTPELKALGKSASRQ
jgi:hypothetical protein